MMLSETEFLSQVRPLLPEYVALSALCGFSGPPNPQHAYELYLNSGPRRDRAALPFLVLGRSNVDRANRLEGNAIDDEELWNFGATHHTNSDDPRVQPRDGLHFQGHKTALQGSILHFPVEAKRVNAASGGWHPMYNDSWVMGGVHAHLEFHLASPRISANIWNADANALTVTGRELTGLTRFGYERVKHPSSGAEVYLCDNRHRADSMTLGRYWIQIAAMMLERGRPLIDPQAKAIAWVHPREINASCGRLESLGATNPGGTLPGTFDRGDSRLNALLTCRERLHREAGEDARQRQVRCVLAIEELVSQQLQLDRSPKLLDLAGVVLSTLKSFVQYRYDG